MTKHLYQSHFQDGTGRAIPTGSVHVYLANSTKDATIYPARNDGYTPSATADSDSIISSSTSGLFRFYVSDADYVPSQKFKLKLSKDGYTSQTYDDIDIIPVEDYKYWIDPSQSDQGSASGRGNRTVSDFLSTVGTTKHATFIYPHLGSHSYTGYSFASSLSLSAYSNIKHEFQEGAQASIDSSMTLRFPSMKNIVSSPRQQIGRGTGSFRFNDLDLSITGSDFRNTGPFFVSCTLDDDASFNLPSSTIGHGIVTMATTSSLDSMWFAVKANGAVTRVYGTSSTATVDKDRRVCVFDGGTYATVKNRMTKSRAVRLTYWY